MGTSGGANKLFSAAAQVVGGASLPRPRRRCWRAELSPQLRRRHLTALGSAAAYASPLPGAPDCEMFPPDNVWNTPVSSLPVDPSSAKYIAAIGPDNVLHPDFGQGDWDGEPIGIPFNVVPGSQPKVPVSFMYASESNPGPYPIPRNALIEGGPSSTGDRHVIVVDTGNCTDYETWSSYPKNGGKSWQDGSGAVFALTSNQLRPASGHRPTQQGYRSCRGSSGPTRSRPG